MDDDQTVGLGAVIFSIFDGLLWVIANFGMAVSRAM